MIINENPKETAETANELALAKVAAWTWYRHGSRFDQTTICDCDYTVSSDIVTRPSRYKLEAMKNAHENARVPTLSFHKSMSSTDHVASFLLDLYEIERISKDLEYYIKSSHDKYYNHKYVNHLHDPSGRRILPLLDRDVSGTKAHRSSKQKKWFQSIHKFCRRNNGGVVENHILRLKDVNVQQKATSI